MAAPKLSYDESVLSIYESVKVWQEATRGRHIRGRAILASVDHTT